MQSRVQFLMPYQLICLGKICLQSLIVNIVFSIKLFPFFNELLKTAQLPKFVYYILTLILLIQLMCMSTWDIVITQIADNEVLMKIINPICSVFLFYSDILNANHNMISMIVFSCLIGIQIIWVIFQTLYYRYKRRFFNWMVYATRIALQFFF